MFYIKPNQSMYTYTFKIDTNYFSPYFQWIPEVPSKSLQFYLTIIFQIRSVTIKPIFDKTDSTKIIFHSAHILNAVTEEDWGIHPHTFKKLPQTEITYCYYDYSDTWFKFMLFQTPRAISLLVH